MRTETTGEEEFLQHSMTTFSPRLVGKNRLNLQLLANGCLLVSTAGSLYSFVAPTAAGHLGFGLNLGPHR